MRRSSRFCACRRITNIAWNDETRTAGRTTASALALSFDNLKTLFGHALLTR